MRQFVYTVAASILFVSFAGTAAHAVKKPARKTMKMAAMKCPNCGMMLSTKKTAARPQMVKLNGKTWYCCSACGSHTKAGKKKGM